MKLGWIPANIKPPEECEKYLITTDSGNIDFAYYDDINVFGRNDGNYRWHLPQYSKLLAWMPLPEPYEKKKKGFWIIHTDNNSSWYECSECGIERGQATSYCPDCGAIMSDEIRME